jgi:hypothetical protein
MLSGAVDRFRDPRQPKAAKGSGPSLLAFHLSCARVSVRNSPKEIRIAMRGAEVGNGQVGGIHDVEVTHAVHGFSSRASYRA